MQLANSDNFVLTFTHFTKNQTFHLTIRFVARSLTYLPDMYTVCWSSYKTVSLIF